MPDSMQRSSRPRVLRMMRTPLLLLAWTVVAALVTPAPAARASGSASADPTTIDVIREASVHWTRGAPEIRDGDGYVVRHHGQTIEQTFAAPARPATPADQQRIVLRVDVTPIQSEHDGRERPNDLWTRLGSICVTDPSRDEAEVELMRFVTGFGAAASFEEDVTAFAPLLHDEVTLRARISTYSDRPGWTISVRLTYDTSGVGARRPLVARPLMSNPHVTASSHTLRAVTVIPAETGTPRLRVLSTGHATDGIGANEFISSTHVLRVDGVEVARWRPWRAGDGTGRARNPYSGRWTIDGREVWSSELDRSGWAPGQSVEPTIIPVPELSPGRHEIELEILGIRAAEGGSEADGPGPHGYWVVSVVLVADGLWETAEQP